MHNYAFDKRSVKKTEECAQLPEISVKIHALQLRIGPKCEGFGRFVPKTQFKWTQSAPRGFVNRSAWYERLMDDFDDVFKLSKRQTKLRSFVNELVSHRNNLFDANTMISFLSTEGDDELLAEHATFVSKVYLFDIVSRSVFYECMKWLVDHGYAVWMRNLPSGLDSVIILKLPEEDIDDIWNYWLTETYGEESRRSFPRMSTNPNASLLKHIQDHFKGGNQGRPIIKKADCDASFFDLCPSTYPQVETGMSSSKDGPVCSQGFAPIYNISPLDITISDISDRLDPVEGQLVAPGQEEQDLDEKREVVEDNSQTAQLKRWWLSQLRCKKLGLRLLRDPSNGKSWLFDVPKAEATVTTLMGDGWSAQDVFDFLNEQLDGFKALRPGKKVISMFYANKFALENIQRNKVKITPATRPVAPPPLKLVESEPTPQPEPPKPQKASRLPERDNTDQAKRTYEHLLGGDIDELTERYHRGDFELTEAMVSLGKSLEDLVNDWRQKRNEATDKQLAQMVEISGVEVEEEAQEQLTGKCEQEELSDEQCVDGPIELHESVAEKLADALPMRTEKQTRDGLAAIGKFLGREPQKDIVIDVSDGPTVITLPVEQTPQRALSEWEQVIAYLREKMTQGAHMLDCITHRKYDELRYVLQAPALSDADKDYMKMQLSHGFKNAVKRHGVQMYFEG